MTDSTDLDDISEPTDRNDPTENADSADPIEPMENAELIEPMLIVFMGVVVGFIAISVMSPIFKLVSNIR